jgi:hypothetical protein
MTGTQPFSPDDDYCVYCHAVAAGPCAACGALCCGDCVELVMGLTRQRAVCRSCRAHGRDPGDARLRRWFGLALAGLLALLLYVLATALD